METDNESLNFKLLTTKQQDFLSSREIKNNTDAGGLKTVGIVDIREESEGTLLVLKDVYSYAFHKNSPGGPFGYARRRIPIYQRLLSIDDAPKELNDSAEYLFELPDNSKVQVQFFTVRDRV